MDRHEPREVSLVGVVVGDGLINIQTNTVTSHCQPTEREPVRRTSERLGLSGKLILCVYVCLVFLIKALSECCVQWITS